jgi:anti-anti-sigma factor
MGQTAIARSITYAPSAHVQGPRLRWQLLIAFVTLTVLPLVIVIPIVLQRMSAHAQEQVYNQLESVGELKHQQLLRWLRTSANEVEQAHALLPTAEAIRLVVEPRASAASATAVSNYLRQFTGDATDTTHAVKPFDLLLLYTPQGTVVAASDEVEIGKVVTQQPYFQASLHGPHTQQPFYAIGTNELALVITRPLLDSSGTPIAVLAAYLNLHELGTTMTERAGLGTSGETYLVSSENSYLLTPSRFDGYPLTRAYHSIGIGRALAGESGADKYDSYRTPATVVFGVYRWIPELQAAMLVEVERSEALHAALQAQNIAIVLALLAGLGAVALGIFGAVRITQPIRILTETARQILDGDLSQRAEVQTRNEIGELALTFNSMAAQLQQQVSTLEQRVAERTVDLEHTLQELQTSLAERDQLLGTVQALSSPVLPIQDGLLVLPLIGVIDSVRAGLIMQTLLTAIEQQQARVVIIDVTGVLLIDTAVAQALIQAAQAVQLLGAQAILVGVRPEIAQTIVGLGITLSGLVTRVNLQHGVSYALEKM